MINLCTNSNPIYISGCSTQPYSYPIRHGQYTCHRGDGARNHNIHQSISNHRIPGSLPIYLILPGDSWVTLYSRKPKYIRFIGNIKSTGNTSKSEIKPRFCNVIHICNLNCNLELTVYATINQPAKFKLKQLF